MVNVLPSAEPPTLDSDLYLGLHQFYSWQMQLLDDGPPAVWACTFTDDGVFAIGDKKFEGLEDITAAAHQSAERCFEAGIIRRHHVGSLTVTVHEDTVRTRCYVSMLESSADMDGSVTRSSVCEDQLVRVDGTWRVKHRQVSRDGVDVRSDGEEPRNRL